MVNLFHRWRRGFDAGAAMSIALLLAVVPPATQAASSDVLAHEEVVFINSGTPGVRLETTIFRPAGAGPFPLVVMNHGKAASAPAKQLRARFPVLSQAFVSRGYAVVLPMRQGFSRSGGSYEDGACDLDLNGRLQAGDVAAAVSYFQAQPWVDARHVMVIGQSHGGMVTLAYGEQAAPGVRLLVNFAGGLRANGGHCEADWQAQMLRAFGHFGAAARVPSLWFYGANDSYFKPDFVQQLLRSFDSGQKAASPAARPAARLVPLGPFGQDGHGLVEYSGALPMWWPALEREMRLRGLPLPSRTISGKP